MKTIKFISIILWGILLSSCEFPNPENPTMGKINETNVMNFFTCKEGQQAIFRSDYLDVIKYTISNTQSYQTDSTLSNTITMKGVNFDGNDFYTIEIEIVCTNKKQIDIYLCYTFKIDEEHVYTQKGTYQYIDTQNTGMIPQSATILNENNEKIALLEYNKGLKYYLDNNNIQYNFKEGTVNW